MKRTDELPSIDAASFLRIGPRGFQQQYRNRGVVIRGLARRWKTFASWQLDQLEELAGHTRVVYHYAPRMNRSEPVYREATFAEFVALASRRPNLILGPAYLDEWNLLWDLPALERDLQADVAGLFPDWLAKAPMVWDLARRQRTSLWIGQEGSGTPMHADSQSAITFLAVLHGAKRLVCFSGQDLGPRYYPFLNRLLDAGSLYIEPSPEGVRDACARLDTRLPTVYHADLEAGDVLHLPARWFHQLRNRALTVSVSRYYYQRANARLSIAQTHRSNGPRAALAYALLLPLVRLSPVDLAGVAPARAERIEAVLNRLTAWHPERARWIDRVLEAALFKGRRRPFSL